MISSELKIGRTFGIRFEHGKDFMTELEEFCSVNNVKQGYVPFFSGDFSEITIVGTCNKTEHPEAPMLNSPAYFENVESLGCGTIAYNKETDQILPHFHISIGSRLSSATAHTSHLIGGKVQFLIEMVLVEVLFPSMERIIDENVFNLKLLDFI